VVGIMVLVVAFVEVDGRTIARAQERTAHGAGATGSAKASGASHMRGTYWPYPIRDPTADERAAIAVRVYGAVLNDWLMMGGSPPRAGGNPPDVEVRSRLELVGRLGPWSLRWREAQDNAARSRAARYQSLSDHLARMSDLEQGRFWPKAGRAKAAGGPVEAKSLPVSAEAARFFRPIDGWSFDRIVLPRFESERPLNLATVAVTPAERVAIAGRVYRAILDEAVGRFLASLREGKARRHDEAIFDALLAERLGFWSDLWSQAEDAADGDAFGRLPGARVRSTGARAAGRLTAAIQAHVERMRELEDGRFVDDVFRRSGRPTGWSVDMSRFREFAEFAHFFRVEAEGRLPGGPSSREADGTDSGQAATAGRIYRTILDESVHRYRETPRAGGATADARIVFDPRLAERLAAWSARWARAQVRADGSRAAQFTAVRSHADRLTALEDGRALRDVPERAGTAAGGPAAPAPPREFADVARFFRLEAQWELEQLKSR
jgi:hypothetical protein